MPQQTVAAHSLNYTVSCQFAVAFSDQSDGHSNLLRPWPRSKVRFNVNTWPPVQAQDDNRSRGQWLRWSRRLLLFWVYNKGIYVALT